MRVKEYRKEYEVKNFMHTKDNKKVEPVVAKMRTAQIAVDEQ